MFVSELLNSDHLLMDLRATDKKHALQELAVYAGAQLRMPSQVIFDALQRREALGATGLGEGFALPHARIEGLEQFFALFARVSKPLSFDAIDEKPVDLIFLLLMPAQAAEAQVGVMSSVCRLFRTNGFADQVRKARSPSEVLAVVQRGARSLQV